HDLPPRPLLRLSRRPRRRARTRAFPPSRTRDSRPSAQAHQVILTIWPSKTATTGHRMDLPWDHILDSFFVPLEHEDKLSLPGWSLATFRDDRRAKANVEAVHALVLDDDSGTVSLDAAATAWEGVDGIIFTTHSYTPEKPRHRTVLAIS